MADYISKYKGSEIDAGIEKVKDIDIASTEYVNTAIGAIAVPTKTSELENDSDFVVDAEYVHTDNNYANEEKDKVAIIVNDGDGTKYLSDDGTYKEVDGGITQEELDALNLSINDRIVSASTSTYSASIAYIDKQIKEFETLELFINNDGISTSQPTSLGTSIPLNLTTTQQLWFSRNYTVEAQSLVDKNVYSLMLPFSSISTSRVTICRAIWKIFNDGITKVIFDKEFILPQNATGDVDYQGDFIREYPNDFTANVGDVVTFELYGRVNNGTDTAYVLLGDKDRTAVLIRQQPIANLSSNKVIDDNGTDIKTVRERLEEKVSSESVDHIVSLTKAEYDALATKDANTIYNITDDFTNDNIAMSQVNGLVDALDLKQNKTDNTLNTTNKTIVGSINEINSIKPTQTNEAITKTIDIANLQVEIDSLPKLLNHNIIFNVNGGTENEAITISNFYGAGTLQIIGASVKNTLTHNVNNFIISGNSNRSISIQGFTATNTTGLSFSLNGNSANLSFTYCNTVAGSGVTSGLTGFQVQSTINCRLISTTISNKNIAVDSASGSNVILFTSLDGVGNNRLFATNVGGYVEVDCPINTIQYTTFQTGKGNINYYDENKYLLTETFTGKYWTNGKAIYKKVIDFGALPNTSEKFVNTDVLGIENVIKIEGYGTDVSGTTIPLPYTHTFIEGNIGLLYTKTSNQVRVATGSDRSGIFGYITIYYTCTDR